MISNLHGTLLPNKILPYLHKQGKAVLPFPVPKPFEKGLAKTFTLILLPLSAKEKPSFLQTGLTKTFKFLFFRRVLKESRPSYKQA
jgi:hypothetical protein